METIYIADKSLLELVSLFSCHVDDDDFYDVIAYNINQLDEGYFVNNISQLSGSQLKGAIFGLGFTKNKSDRLYTLLKKFLMHEDPMVVSETIDSLNNLECKESIVDVNSMLNHSSPYVRGALLRYVRKIFPEETAFDYLKEALNDDSFIVRENAIDELSELSRGDILSLITPFTEDVSEDVRQAAKTAIDNLKE